MSYFIPPVLYPIFVSRRVTPRRRPSLSRAFAYCSSSLPVNQTACAQRERRHFVSLFVWSAPRRAALRGTRLADSSGRRITIGRSRGDPQGSPPTSREGPPRVSMQIPAVVPRRTGGRREEGGEATDTNRTRRGGRKDGGRTNWSPSMCVLFPRATCVNSRDVND